MAKSKKDKINRKCSSCSLDCTVSRGIAVADVAPGKRAEVIKNLFSEAKPKYSRENCPKM